MVLTHVSAPMKVRELEVAICVVRNEISTYPLRTGTHETFLHLRTESLAPSRISAIWPPCACRLGASSGDCCASTGDFRERAGGARKDVTDDRFYRSDLAVPSCLSPTRSSSVGKQLSLSRLTISSNHCLPIARSMRRGVDRRMAGFTDAFGQD